MGKNKAQEWAEKCSESNGSMFMLPEDMIKENEALATLRKEAEEMAKKFNKLNAELDVMGKNFFYHVRQKAEEAEIEGIWEKHVGFNQEAQKDGITVINIIAQGPKPMQM